MSRQAFERPGGDEPGVSVYFELDPDVPLPPAAVVAACIERGASSVLADEKALSPAFFDLSSGLAGELLHKLDTYRIRLAGVVPDPGVHSAPFRQFLRETNRGSQFRFFTNREEAVSWLESL